MGKVLKYILIYVFVICPIGIGMLFLIPYCIDYFEQSGSKHSPKLSKQELKIEEAIANRQFEEARMLVLGMEEPQDDGQYARAYGEKSEKEQLMEKVNRAQISLMVSDGDLEDAASLSSELNCTDLFWEEISKNVRQIYESSFRELYILLTRYPITATYHSYLRDFDVSRFKSAESYAREKRYGENAYYESNVGYNDQVGKFNNIVLSIIDLAIFDGKTTDLKKLVLLLKPEAVETRRKKSYDYYDDYFDIYYKQENRAKQQALAKIKEAGLRI